MQATAERASTLKVSIQSYIDGLEKADQAGIDAATASREAVKQQALDAEKQLGRIRAEQKAKLDLIKGMEQEGVDTSTVKIRVEQLAKQISQLSDQHASLLQRVEQAVIPAKRDFARERRLASLLEKVYSCKDAILVDEINECWKSLPVAILKLDDAGRPATCGVITYRRGQQFLEILEVAVAATSGRYARSFRPTDVVWLPKDATAHSESRDDHHEENGRRQSASVQRGHTQNHVPSDLIMDGKDGCDEDHNSESRFAAFVERKSNRLILAKTKLEWRTTRVIKAQRYDERDREEWVDTSDDFADIAISLASIFDESVKDTNGILDVASDYTAKPHLQRLKSLIIEKTTDKPLFVPTSEQLSSTEVLARIKPHWELFVNCPWSWDIRGDLAVLKYLVENGERPRFWIDDFASLYGLRVRTRDHNWIVGQIYIADGPESSLQDRSAHVDRQTGVVRVGKMWMKINSIKD